MSARLLRVILLPFALILCAPGLATTQSPGKISRVGVLSPFLGPDSLFFETLRVRLQELGYVEGRNISFVYRAAEDFDQLQARVRWPRSM